MLCPQKKKTKISHTVHTEKIQKNFCVRLLKVKFLVLNLTCCKDKDVAISFCRSSPSYLSPFIRKVQNKNLNVTFFFVLFLIDIFISKQLLALFCVIFGAPFLGELNAWIISFTFLL